MSHYNMNTFHSKTELTTFPTINHTVSNQSTRISVTSRTSITMAVFVVIGIIVFVIVYTTELKNKIPSSNTFESLEVKDTNGLGQPFFIGDKLLLTYMPLNREFSGKVNWWISVDGGNNYDKISGTTGNSNFVYYIVPVGTFTTQAIFKVSRQDMTGDFLITGLISILPRLFVSDGPGSTHAGDTVYNGTDTTNTAITTISVLKVDPFLLPFTQPNQWILSTGTIDATPQSIHRIVADTVAETLTIYWTATMPQNNIHGFFQTTNLISFHYPSELSVITPYTFTIATSPSSALSTTFTLLSLVIVDRNGVTPRIFTPGDTITIRVTFGGIWESPLTWITDNSEIPTFSPTLVSTTNHLAIYSFVWPYTLFTDYAMIITAKKGILSVSSTPTFIQPNFTLSELFDRTIPSYSGNAPNQNSITTNIHMKPGDVAAYISWLNADWTWSLSSQHSSQHSSQNRISSVQIVDDQLFITWSANWQETDMTHSGETFTSIMYISATLVNRTITNQTGTPITFVAGNYNNITNYG